MMKGFCARLTIASGDGTKCMLGLVLRVRRKSLSGNNGYYKWLALAILNYDLQLYTSSDLEKPVKGECPNVV
jgi:hypothetical protein